MKKTITGIFWTLTLSLTPALSMENDRRPEGREVLCKTQHWKDGKMLREEITYAPETPKSTPPSGMGAWGETITYNSLPKSGQSSGGTWEDSIIFNTPVQNPPSQEPTQRSGMGAWESMAMNLTVQDSPTTLPPDIIDVCP